MVSPEWCDSDVSQSDKSLLLSDHGSPVSFGAVSIGLDPRTASSFCLVSGVDQESLNQSVACDMARRSHPLIHHPMVGLGQEPLNQSVACDMARRSHPRIHHLCF